MNEKVKPEFKLPENKTIEYGGVKIEIKPFLSFAQQSFLINAYVKEYFTKRDEKIIEDSEYNYLEAEYGLMNYIFQLSTNIEVDDLDKDVYADMDLWDDIISEILNYSSLRYKLHKTIADIKEQNLLNNSTGKVISDLLAKIIPLIDEIKNLSPEEIKAMQDKSSDLLKELQDSSVIADATKSTGGLL